MTPPAPRAPGQIRIQLRHYAALRGPMLAVALVVLALAALVAAAPTVFTRLADAEITQATTTAPLSARYLISHPAGRIVETHSQDPESSGLGDLDGSYGGWHDQLAALRAGLPQPLRSHVGTAGWTISYNALDVGPNPDGDPASARTSIATTLDPHPDRVARLVEGTWPSADLGGDFLSVTLSRRTATALGVALGGDIGDFRIVGIFEPIDPDADYWQLNPGLTQVAVYDDGNTVSVTAGAYIGAAQAGMKPISGQPGAFQSLTGQILVWYPLDLSGMTPSEARQILAQLSGAAAAPRPVPPDAPNLQPELLRGAISEISLDIGVADILAASLGRIDAASAVLTVALSGPLIAAVAVLVATLLMLLRRGRAATSQLAMRGSSRTRIRLHWIGAGLIAGVPAAAVAVIAVRIVAGAQAAGWGLALGAAIGLTPAVLLGAAPATVLGADIGGRRATSRAGRLIAEIAAVLLAATSVYLLLAGGDADDAARKAGSTASSAGIDLLVVAAPALSVAAACVIVLRLYPVPLRAMASWMRRRRGPVGFIGSLRGLRDPIVGAVPVVAVLAGVAVAGMSGALLTTIDTGTERAALTQLGAPIRVASASVQGITAEEYRRIEELPGVAAAARFSRVSTTPVQIPGQPLKPSAELIQADLAALAEVQRDVQGGAPFVLAPEAPTDTPVAGIASENLAPVGTTVSIGPQQIDLAAAVDEVPGISRSRTFLVIDSSVTGFGAFRPSTVLVAPAAGADPETVAQSVADLLGPQSVISSAAGTVAELRSGAMTTGMRLTLYGALGTAALAMVAALLLSVVMATPMRTRLMAIARVLGLTRRERRALIVWEQAPVALAALIGGAGLGVGLAALIRTAINLAPFTGGSTAPPLVIDWTQMALLFVGFVAVVAVAVAVGMVLTRGTTAATAISVDEE